MPGSGLILNDRDASEWGWKTESIGGGPGVLAWRWPTQPLAGSLGAVVTTTEPDSPLRQLVVSGILRGSNNADAQTKLEALLNWCSRGALEIRTAHSTSRLYVGRLSGTSLPLLDPSFLSDTAKGSLTFDLTTPYQLECLPRTYSITTTGSTGRVALLLGTGTSRPIIQIRGAATNPKLTLYDAFGVAVSEMNFTITLGADDFLGIDCLTRKVTKSVSGVISAADSTRKQGDDFFALLSRYGSHDAQRFVYLELSSGRARVIVRRSWKL